LILDLSRDRCEEEIDGPRFVAWLGHAGRLIEKVLIFVLTFSKPLDLLNSISIMKICWALPLPRTPLALPLMPIGAPAPALHASPKTGLANSARDPPELDFQIEIGLLPDPPQTRTLKIEPSACFVDVLFPPSAPLNSKSAIRNSKFAIRNPKLNCSSLIFRGTIQFLFLPPFRGD
jgi:hypothetical protein